MTLRLVRYAHGGATSLGVERGGVVHALSAHPAGEPTLQDLTNRSYLDALADAVDDGALPTTDSGAVDALAPVPDPGKIVCVGLNYRDHAEEQDEEPPEAPLLFSKAPTSVTNPGDPIVHPGGEEVDYEVELAVVMGRTAKNVDAADADDYVAGYTALNDVSGRTAQMGDGQFFRGKSYDTFSPMGPAMRVDADYDPNAVDVACRVDGETRQDSNTEQFVFDVHDLVEYISANMTLRPGDVISTGTPGGVGIFREPPTLLEPGDTVEVEVEGVGVLRNHVVDDPTA
jgi:2-keto-4-pentenoate hydratase/2-oxohepta-3-ene-1,7-dioic acid hydratase in catechol pathway